MTQQASAGRAVRDVTFGNACRRPRKALDRRANRDPDVFPHPDRYDIQRADQHLSFARGPHFCFGAHPARLEIATALLGDQAYLGSGS